MTREKPNCPSCKSVACVRTLGGGTHNKYRYICDECDARWQQTPPHRISDEVPADDNDISIITVNDKRQNNYKCGKCGLPKKGHTCIANYADINAEKVAAEILINTIHQPASSAFDQQVKQVKKAKPNPMDIIPLPLSFGQRMNVPFSAYKGL